MSLLNVSQYAIDRSQTSVGTQNMFEEVYETFIWHTSIVSLLKLADFCPSRLYLYAVISRLLHLTSYKIYNNAYTENNMSKFTT